MYLDNYFSTDKAQRDLGYEPPSTTEKAISECLPYYVDMFRQMKSQALAAKAAAAKPTVSGSK